MRHSEHSAKISVSDLDQDQSQGGAANAAGILGLSGKVAELGIGKMTKILPPELISIYTVAEKEIAHFKAKIVFRLTSPATNVEAMRLELPKSNLVVFYVQLINENTSIYRIGIQEETESSLVYTFDNQFVLSTVQVIIRGSFKYLENPGVGLVTLLFPCLVGSYQKDSLALGPDRRAGDEMYNRDQRLEVHCLLTLPAPFQRIVGGQSIRLVSPDSSRIFVRHTEACNMWDSVEFCVMCGSKNPTCPTIIVHHPKEYEN